MRVVRVRHSALAAAAVVVLTALLPQAVAHAAAPKATVYPLTKPIPGLSSAGQMVEANGSLFVSSPAASTVTVITTSGAVRATITGLQGASGLAVTGDGKDVYVALPGEDKIGIIDTTSLQEVGSFPVDAETCPTSLALASGRLFYTFGCPDAAADSAGVSSIDPVACCEIKPAVTDLPAAGLLRSNGHTLAVTTGGDAITTYSAATDGTVTTAATATVDNVEDLAFTSDGTSLLVATSSPDQITSFATATMTENPVAYLGGSSPQAVAADPHGKYVAAGFHSATTTAELYTQSSGSARWARFTAGADPTTWVSGRSVDTLVPQTLIFSTAGSHVFGLVKRAGVKDLFLFDSTIDPAASTVTVKVPKVGVGEGHTATSKGPAGVPVDFLLTDAGQTTSLGTKLANAAGVATVRFVPKYSGAVTAVALGSPATLPARGRTTFRVASYTAYRLLGKHQNDHGVAVYSSYRKLKIEFTTAPAEPKRAAVAYIQRRVHKHWRTTERLHGPEKYFGVRIHFTSLPKHVEYRVRLSVAADADSGASSATSQPFEIS